MKIGLRTLKTVIATILSMAVASYFQLLYWPSAGIIAVLSVGNTKRSSLLVGVYRFFAFCLATMIAFLCFTLIGYTPLAFGVYLLLFIPVAVFFHLEEGIVVNSVLVTHYLVEGHMGILLIYNEALLLFIGIIFALVMNLYMPNLGTKLKEDQQIIEGMFRELLKELAVVLDKHTSSETAAKTCFHAGQYIRESQLRAQRHQDNYWLRKEFYFDEYFSMRRAQINVLQDMLDNLTRIQQPTIYSQQIRGLLLYTAKTFSKDNDGQENMRKIQRVYQTYREMPLPQTRKEFEDRAELFQFLQSFKSFIEIKQEFAQTMDTRLSTKE